MKFWIKGCNYLLQAERKDLEKNIHLMFQQRKGFCLSKKY